MPRVDEATMKRQITAHWDARAPLLDVPAWHVAKSEREDAAWRETLARHLPARSALAVLDIGTGLGYLAGVAAALGRRAAGIDIAPRMIERAGERAARLGLTIDLRVADVDALPFADGAFDAITERNVLWTMPDPARTLAELRRVLRPGGHLLVMESRWLERAERAGPGPGGRRAQPRRALSGVPRRPAPDGRPGLGGDGDRARCRWFHRDRARSAG